MPDRATYNATALTTEMARALIARLRARAYPFRRVPGGFLTTCPCCGERQALFIEDPDAPDAERCRA